MTVRISPRKTALALAFITLLLILGHVLGQAIRLNAGPDALKGLVRVLNMDGEESVPAWFSSSLLLFCALLLVIISSAKKKEGDRFAAHWRILSVIFVLMSMDEAVAIHETLGEKLRLALHTGGFLTFAWVIPAAIFIALLALAYRNFLLDLPAKTSALFVAAGAVYVGGALGLELIEGKYLAVGADLPALLILITTTQETLEIAGLIVFMYALMSYINSQGKSEICIGPEPEITNHDGRS
jgi:hypothetical protein